MEQYKKLEVLRFPKSDVTDTAENRFWKQFKPISNTKHVARVTDIAFSPAKPYNFAIASSARVCMTFVLVLPCPLLTY